MTYILISACAILVILTAPTWVPHCDLMAIYGLAILPVWFAVPLPIVGAAYPPVFLMLVLLVVNLRPSPDSRIHPLLAPWQHRPARFLLLISLVFFALCVLVALANNFLFLARASIALWIVPLLAGIAVFGRSKERTLLALRWATLLAAAQGLLGDSLGYPASSLFAILDPSQAGLANIQERSGVVRLEGSWGHSIAYGAFLSAGLYLWCRESWRRALPASLFLIAAIALTVSRSAYISAAIALVAAVMLSSKSFTTKIFFSIILAVSGVTLNAVTTSLTTGNAGTELDRSTDYRGLFFDLALENGNLVGPARGLTITKQGLDLFGIRFFDNVVPQLITLVGFVATSLFCLLLVASILIGLATRSITSVLLLIQLPAILTAGLIAQHQMFLWLLLGGSLVELAASSRRRLDPTRWSTKGFRQDSHPVRLRS